MPYKKKNKSPFRKLKPSQIDVTPELVAKLREYAPLTFQGEDLGAMELIGPPHSVSPATLYRLLNGRGTWTPAFTFDCTNQMIKTFGWANVGLVPRKPFRESSR